MNMFDFRLVENSLSAIDFLRLKVATGFRNRPIDQVEQALENDLFDVVAIINNEVVGMGRLVGDGVMYWYLQEIIVFEYSCAMKSHFRKSGNQMSGKWKSSYASLLA